MVRFHNVNFLNLVITRQLTRYAAVTATDDKHLAHMRVHSHRHMHNHLIINKFVLFRKNDGTITADKTTKLLGFKNVNTLKIRILAKKLLFYFNIKLHIIGMIIRKPKLHGITSFINILKYSTPKS